MIATAVALLVALLAGAVLYRAVRRDAHFEELLAGGFLLGLGVASLSLLFLDLFGVTWNRFSLLAIIISTVLLSLRGARAPLPAAAGAARPRSTPAIIVDLIVLLVLVGYTRFATAAPLPEFDFLTDWGLKGKLFWEHRGIDWQYLETAWDRNIHADYPPLLPLMFDYVAVIAGRWDDRAIGLIFTALGAAALLMVRRTLACEGISPVFVSLCSLALVSVAVTPWVGLAEGPLIAYVTAGLLLVRRDLRQGISGVPSPNRKSEIGNRPWAVGPGSLFLGFAALTKNEGIAFVIAVTIAVLITQRRALAGLWPAFALGGIWQVLRAVHGLPTDLALGDVFSRVLSHLAEPRPLFEAFARFGTGRGVFWLGITIALLLQLRVAKREAFVLLTLLIQLAFYVASYLASPHEVGWHIKWSWERLVFHLTLPLATVTLLLLLPLVDVRKSRSLA